MTKLGALIAEYASIVSAAARLEKRKKVIRRVLDRLFDRLKVDTPLSADGYRAHRYVGKRTVTWDLKELAGILERAGVPEEIMERVFSRVVDEEELNALVEGGYVELSEIQKAGSVREHWSVKVSGGTDVR